MLCSGSLEFCKAISRRMKNSNVEGSQRCHRKQKKRGIMYSVCYICKRKRENNVSLYVFCLHKEILTQDPNTSCTQEEGEWRKMDSFYITFYILKYVSVLTFEKNKSFEKEHGERVNSITSQTWILNLGTTTSYLIAVLFQGNCLISLYSNFLVSGRKINKSLHFIEML